MPATPHSATVVTTVLVTLLALPSCGHAPARPTDAPPRAKPAARSDLVIGVLSVAWGDPPRGAPGAPPPKPRRIGLVATDSGTVVSVAIDEATVTPPGGLGPLSGRRVRVTVAHDSTAQGVVLRALAIAAEPRP